MYNVLGSLPSENRYTEQKEILSLLGAQRRIS